ncbi:hypothetical protein [uncultured Jatrophihabitans sp.]|uniref:hypothetical protein n=1 Tax=uncultured Jatrophihabitans sp. TaxID=1610747 RepID=UPI0035CADC6D
MTDYVTHDAWHRPAGRPDAIDEIADQYERPADAGAQQFWDRESGAGWPQTPRPWHGDARRLRIAS